MGSGIIRRWISALVLLCLVTGCLAQLPLGVRAIESCGRWATGSTNGDKRIAVTLVSTKPWTDIRPLPDCTEAFKLENHTEGAGLIAFDGYTLKVKLRTASNAEVHFVTGVAGLAFPEKYYGQDFATLPPGYKPEMQLKARDLANNGQLALDFTVDAETLQMDLALLIVNTLVSSRFQRYGCAVDTTAIVFFALTVADQLANAFSRAMHLDIGGFRDEFGQIVPTIFDSLRDYLVSAGKSCAREKILGDMWDMLPQVWGGIFRMTEYLNVQGKQAAIELTYQPPSAVAAPSFTVPAPRTPTAIPPSPTPVPSIVVAPTATKTPTAATQANEVAYVSAQEDLWVANIDGTNARKLIVGPVAAPRWSRDGKRIAYYRIARNPGTNAVVSLWIANADGSNPLRVDQEVVGNTNVQWGPGDSSLYYVTGRQGSPETIIKFNLATNRGEQLGLNGWVFDVASDGTIAFHECDNSGRCSLVAIGASGQRTVLLPGGNSSVCCAAWSPDGKRIAMTRGSAILVANRDGSGQTQIATSSPALGGLNWSPDGATLVFGTAPGVGPQSTSMDIWTVPATGGNPTKRFAGTTPAWKPIGTPSGESPSTAPAADPPTIAPARLDQGALTRRLTQLLGVRSVRAGYLPDGQDGQPRVAALIGGRGEDFSGEAAACAKYGGGDPTGPSDTTPCLLVIRLGQGVDSVLFAINTTFYHPVVVNFCVSDTPDQRIVIDLYSASSRAAVPYRQEYQNTSDRLIRGASKVLELGGKLPTELPCSEVLR